MEKEKGGGGGGMSLASLKGPMQLLAVDKRTKRYAGSERDMQRLNHRK